MTRDPAWAHNDPARIGEPGAHPPKRDLPDNDPADPPHEPDPADLPKGPNQPAGPKQPA